MNFCRRCGQQWELVHSCPGVPAHKLPKTAAERKAAQRQRNAEAGLVRFEVYAHPEDHEALKALAEKLRRKREKAHGRTTSLT